MKTTKFDLKKAEENGGYTCVPNWIIKDKRLTTLQKMIIICITSNKENYDLSINQIALTLGVRWITVKNTLKKMEEIKLINIINNVYFFNNNPNEIISKKSNTMKNYPNHYAKLPEPVMQNYPMQNYPKVKLTMQNYPNPVMQIYPNHYANLHEPVMQIYPNNNNNNKIRITKKSEISGFANSVLEKVYNFEKLKSLKYFIDDFKKDYPKKINFDELKQKEMFQIYLENSFKDSYKEEDYVNLDYIDVACCLLYYNHNPLQTEITLKQSQILRTMFLKSYNEIQIIFEDLNKRIVSTYKTENKQTSSIDINSTLTIPNDED